MDAAGLDVLLAQANNDFMGGYVKYLTDLPATNGYVTTVLFFKDEPMTDHRPGRVRDGQPSARRKVTGSGGALPGVMGTPSYASAHYSAAYDAELAARALERYATGTIGMLGTAAISFALIETLRNGALRGARFVDASDVIDPIKAVKSAG